VRAALVDSFGGSGPPYFPLSPFSGQREEGEGKIIFLFQLSTFNSNKK